MGREAWWVVPITVAGLACAKTQETPPDAGPAALGPEARLSIYVVNYPLQYFAERIGGERVEVSFPAPAEGDPAYWSPDPETIAAYQRADLILLNGAGYAGWVELAALPRAKLVDTSATFRDRLIALESGPVHSHGPEGEHSHKGYAFTTWLDPTLAIEQARAVAAALSRARPRQADQFRMALAELESDLGELDRRLAAIAESVAGQPLLFSHPVFQYLVRRHRLDARSVHWEPDRVPDEEMWRQLEEMLAARPAGWMIWEDVPAAATVSRLDELGVGSLVYRPCANVPPEGDLLAAARNDLDSLEDTLSAAAGGSAKPAEGAAGDRS